MCKLHTTMSSKMLLFLVNYNAYCHRLHFEYILLSFYMWLIYIWIHSAANDTVADVHTDKYKVGTVDVILSAAYVRPQGWTLAERFMYQHTGTRATHATRHTGNMGRTRQLHARPCINFSPPCALALTDGSGRVTVKRSAMLPQQQAGCWARYIGYIIYYIIATMKTAIRAAVARKRVLNKLILVFLHWC